MHIVEIEKLDHFGNGIAHINNKVVFIPNALPGEVVEIKVINEKKKFCEGIVVCRKKNSPDRISSVCPYFNECGGCNLLFYEYEKTLEWKKEKARELIKKHKINYLGNIEIVENSHFFNYRNKISLKVVNKKLGYYKENTHDLVEINKCIVASSSINQVIKHFKLLGLKNGELTIRSNYNNEILLVIQSKFKQSINIEALKEKIKLVGIVYNDKTIYGQNFFYERIAHNLFKVSYNSFFQINHYITESLFSLVEKHIEEKSIVLDLYCGVGTLSIIASKKAKEVYGIEIIPNAVLNAVTNASMNKQDNIKFMVGDVSRIVDKIKIDFNTIIVDPPRKGLDKNTINYIINKKAKKIIYISCDINTLMRDLKLLENLYEIKEYKLLDMFSYSYHIENFIVLELK